MRPKYYGVKCYSTGDWALPREVEKAENKILKYDSAKEYDDINEIIELYNIDELLKMPISLRKLGEVKHNEYVKRSKGFKEIVASYFAKINDSNFIDICNSVSIIYIEDYWKLFELFKTYNQVSNEIFIEYLNLQDKELCRILLFKKIVNYYGISIAKHMRMSDQTARILISTYMEKNGCKYFIPKELKPKEYENILVHYIESENADPNDLKLIVNYQSTKDCPVNDKVRVKAIRAIKNFWKKPEPIYSTVNKKIEIKFQEQEEVKKYVVDREAYILTYDIRWLENSLDNPSILNNFIYVFDMLDVFMRSNLVSVQSKISALENSILIEGNKDFHKGNQFEISKNVSSAKMSIYYDFLKRHNIELENIFKWFFEEYLENEFGIKGFFMTASYPSASMVEHCRNIASEIDGVLKQFRMYVCDGVIDREEYEMSSRHLIIDDFPSLIKDKYAYANSREINQEMFMLFSDQSMLWYTKKEGTRKSTFFEVLLNEKTNCDDYEEYQLINIDWLIQRKCIDVSKEGFYEPSMPKCAILKDLYDHDVICLYKIKDVSGVLQKMINEGDLRINDTLFSEPETKFLNYELNKSKFSNGLDLRNKYVHATYPQNDNDQKRDYIELLKVMDLIVTKINDELCIKFPEKS